MFKEIFLSYILGGLRDSWNLQINHVKRRTEITYRIRWNVSFKTFILSTWMYLHMLYGRKPESHFTTLFLKCWPLCIFSSCLIVVALNYQTPGLMTDLYDGKFHQNGQCGYVLKPSIMREGNKTSYFRVKKKSFLYDIKFNGDQVLRLRASGSYLLVDKMKVFPKFFQVLYHFLQMFSQIFVQIVLIFILQAVDLFAW